MKVLLLAALPLLTCGQNDDLFTYGETDADARIFGPRDWNQVGCDDLDTCSGWPTKWQFALGWKLEENHCENCEEQDNCGEHHQTPVPLNRSWGERKHLGDIGIINCGDNHWMKYESGTCTWDHLKAADAVTVERHGFRIAQPVEKVEDEYRLNCLTEGRGRLFSRLDMSGGFSQWWWLNGIEIKTPSEHTQNGKRYAAEVQIGHFYSASSDDGTDNGSQNEMQTVGIFLDARDDIEPYPYLDKLICQWRLSQENVRKACGIESVKTQYPGCTNFNREGNATTTARQELTNNARKKRNLRKMVIDRGAPQEEANVPLQIDPGNYRDAEWTEEEWAKFQEEYSRQHPLNSSNPFSNGRRHLMDYDHITHFNHQFLLDVRTEFYYRYAGTTNIPPCYGKERSGSNSQTNLWRFMKDPIRINTRQIKEMHRLLRERIAPIDSLRNACQPDTAARIEDDGTAWVARPMQELNDRHDYYFCECEDWGTKIPEEIEWCASGNRERNYRWYVNVYNFPNNGTF